MFKVVTRDATCGKLIESGAQGFNSHTDATVLLCELALWLEQTGFDLFPSADEFSVRPVLTGIRVLLSDQPCRDVQIAVEEV